MRNQSVTNELQAQATSADVKAPPGTARLLLVILELALVAGVVYLFKIESRRYFFPVFCWITAGFGIHACLPMRYRLLFFALLSMATILFVLGLAHGAAVLAIGGVLIGICYLPLSFLGRVDN